MAKKKTAKKSVKAKKPVKKVVKKPTPKVSKQKVSKKPASAVVRMRMALGNLITFIILFVLSLILYTVSNEEFYLNLFLMLSMIFGFLSVAFLIAYLVFVFRNVMKK